MKFLLDFAPALLFFGAYFLSDIYVATALLIGSLFAVVAVYRLWKREWHKAHLATALIAAVLGGLTIYIHDPAFIKLKPTAVYAVFALALLTSHVIGERVLLQRLPQKTFVLPERVWRKVNLVWAAFFTGCALLNLYVAGNYDEATWVRFKTFGFTALTFVFLLAHIPFLQRYLPQD
ncbi:MAG: septation protein IspZ [Nevskiales bacterium]|nr:septation protein IspZ [Nevskiales bacterium]